MAMAKVFFSDLKAGRCSSVVEARLLRYWEARNVKRGGELMWMDLLMVDVNSTVMQVTISAGRLPQFLEQLHAGTMFSVTGFDVSRCAQNFRLTDSSLMIRFNESTSFQELTEPVSPLPEEAFRFRNHSELIGLANTNTQLPDIIGEILSVKSTVCDPPEEKNRVMVTLKLDSDETVTLSFFDSQAVAFHIQLEAMRVDPKVMVVTSINPKIVGDIELCRLFLNATSGTHVYFDKNTGAGAALFYRLAARDTGLPSAAPLLKSYAKVENMTIADLNSFIVSAASQSTSFQELTEPVSPLPEEAFRFRNQSELIGLANTNTQLPENNTGFELDVDIIGEILSVKSTVCDPPEEKNRVMVTLKLDSDETVTLSFFDSQAVAFHKQLEAMRVDPKVMVVTSINPKIVGGRLFLNATSETHVYFDKKTRAGDARFDKLIARDTGLPSAAPLLMSYAKVETMTIADLSSFIVTAESQEIDFLCTGKVVRVDTDKGWCYVACSKCSKKLQRTESAFTCGVCNNSHAVGALRYRVEMAISDDTAEGTFVWFDGVLTKLHSIRASEAAQMLAEDGVNPENTRLPPFIADMEGKTYTFQVRVTAFNFTEHHRTFTITRIADDHGRLPVDGVGNSVSYMCIVLLN
ncbi:hypothetical protein F2Q68_00023894 [Brassica cretica]|uniref:Replication factor A C-terminal domain-containing protein n=1 Tax=Brassica cretica TaxID=69181 RepID=A0A8S9IJW5_BRACR|nr:hypothetical protein F2Q68_00023894 [Brassica cretica]